MEQPIEKKHTYADLLKMDDGERVELIHGELYKLPSVTLSHQVIFRELFSAIIKSVPEWHEHFYLHPLDVRLFEKKGDAPEDVDTVVMPDIMFVCDNNKVDQRGIKGVPDWIIEITSRKTHRQDVVTKYNLYGQAGVWEYWLVEPEEQTIEVFVLNKTDYLEPVELYSKTDIAKSTVLPGLSVDMSTIFPKK